MEEKTTTLEQKSELPEPNPVTRASHRRAFTRQVLLPLVLFLLVSIALTVVFAMNGVGTVETWSQIATILLVSFWMLGGLILLALTAVLVYLVTSVLKTLPSYTRMAQEGIETIRTQVEKGADITAKPVIQIQSFLAAVNALFRRKS